jgi:hypothetical protein
MPCARSAPGPSWPSWAPGPCAPRSSAGGPPGSSWPWCPRSTPASSSIISSRSTRPRPGAPSTSSSASSARRSGFAGAGALLSPTIRIAPYRSGTSCSSTSTERRAGLRGNGRNASSTAKEPNAGWALVLFAALWLTLFPCFCACSTSRVPGVSTPCAPSRSLAGGALARFRYSASLTAAMTRSTSPSESSGWRGRRAKVEATRSVTGSSPGGPRAAPNGDECRGT